MRVAVVTDIHGNQRALRAVLADLKHVAPDLILHGGDLVFGGTRPAEIIDEIRSLGGPEFIGDERLRWLKTLPAMHVGDGFAVLHASPGDLWRAPMVNASNEEVQKTYAGLCSPTVVYGHLHVSYVRRLPGMTVANAGSVSQSYDGDRRAAYAESTTET